jgi:enoyl-CoA hydratase
MPDEQTVGTDGDGPSQVRYELRAKGTVAAITLARPEKRNAQGRRMTAELDAAFTTAARDDTVKVIVLFGDGPHFSAGHDLSDTERYDYPPLFTEGSPDRFGAPGLMAYETEVYLSMCRRWHDIPKPTIAAVQGRTIAGGLMLMWVCDLIVATEDASFSDPTVGFGVNGVEWFCHPWELGIRKAKEMLFTGDEIGAEEARQLGMVNHVVPADQLTIFTMGLAGKIARRPAFSLKLAKLAVNQALDAQGFQTAQQAAFSLQHVGHAHTHGLQLRKALAEAVGE